MQTLKTYYCEGPGTGGIMQTSKQKYPCRFLSSFCLSCGKPIFEGVGMVENVSAWHFFNCSRALFVCDPP